MMKRQMIMLENLNCPSCAAKLEKGAQQLPGVVKAQVAFGTGALTIEFDEARLDQQQLRELIGRLGLAVATVINRA